MTSATFRQRNRVLAEEVIGILNDERPMMLRKLFYRLVWSGHLPRTDKQHYNRPQETLDTVVKGWGEKKLDVGSVSGSAT